MNFVLSIILYHCIGFILLFFFFAGSKTAGALSTRTTNVIAFIFCPIPTALFLGGCAVGELDKKMAKQILAKRAAKEEQKFLDKKQG